MTYRQLLSSNADFRRLWTGQVVSEVGDWLNNIAVLALVIQLAGASGVGLAVALYAIARHLPLFLFGPVAGVVVDRVSRRRVMIAADLARAALALGFLLASRLSSLAVIYAVGAALFAVSAFFNAAKRASIPNLVEGTDSLLAANSLSASTTAATIAVGSALGGVIATALGRDTVFILNALTFVASAEMIRRIRRPLSRAQKAEVSRQKAEDSSQTLRRRRDELPGLEVQTPEVTAHRSPLTAYFSEFHEGLRYVRRDGVLSAVFVAAAGWGLGNGAARALYSIFGARLGEQAAAGWGAGVRAVAERPTDFGISVLFVAMGLGGVLGAPLARRFNRGGSGDLGARMGRSLTLDGAGLLLFSFMPNLLGAAVVLIAREMNFAIWWTAQQTLVMRRTEDRFAGRVFASFETLTTLMMVGSILVSGEVADRLGIRPVAAGGGSVVILSGLLWFILRRRDEKRR
ncbi:MAG TPA: MFS transporter [Pyrinomonadaceae bacterium]|jgi:MFS family permease|nr:MFS transporter [Pyrinomonadaceae bacterium]